MIITSFYSFLLIDLQSYKLFKFMQIFCRRKKTQKHTKNAQADYAIT